MYISLIIYYLIRVVLSTDTYTKKLVYNTIFSIKNRFFYL